jgi:DNA repair exonuclease SbcCD ATPase subunit
MTLRKLFILFTMALITLSAAQPSFAQLSRKERKQLKRELRKISPEELDRMKAEQEQKQQKINDLSKQTSQLQEEIQNKDHRISTLKSELKELQKEVDARGRTIAELKEKEDEWEKGLVFRVQLGAFDDLDFRDALGRNPKLIYEETDDWKKYIMGNFRSYEEANTLKKHLRLTGIRDAWIVPYRDGQRVPLKEVLDEVLAERELGAKQ